MILIPANDQLDGVCEDSVQRQSQCHSLSQRERERLACYCMLYVLALIVKIVLSIVSRLILAFFVVYGEWVNLATVNA